MNTPSNELDNQKSTRRYLTASLKPAIGHSIADDAKVMVIDRDSPNLQSTLQTIAATGYRTVGVASAADLLTSLHLQPPCCVVMETNLGERHGLEVLNELKRLPYFVPVIFLTAFPAVQTAIAALKAGAIDYLVKPVDSTELFAVINAALVRQAQRLEFDSHVAKYKEGLGRLTDREKEVLLLITKGLLNKQVAARLGTCEKTIKVHRGRVMRKMRATSFAELVQMAERASISST